MTDTVRLPGMLRGLVALWIRVWDGIVTAICGEPPSWLRVYLVMAVPLLVALAVVLGRRYA